MIPRYSLPEMAAVWSDETRLANWLEIEILAVEAWSELGRIPPEDARAIRERAAFTVDRVLEVEAITRHDVAAFVQVVADSIGPEGRWVHFGMTSSDVVDTGLALQLRSAADLLLERLEVLLGVVKRLALRHRDTVMIGRSHGIHAEPTSFGHKLAVMAFELDRDRQRLRLARETVSVGAISGVVGTYAAVDPRVEQIVCARLGLSPEEASTQVIQRDRHAEFVSVLAITASTLDRIATEVRHLARSEVREVQEPFAAGQKGSSAMPHKRNPVVSRAGERACSRASAGTRRSRWRTCALWHERDISHSSAERVILPDATGLLHFMLSDMAWVMEGLHVDPDRMLANLESTGGLVFSQKVLPALVDHGMARDAAYGAVQRAANGTWDEDCTSENGCGRRSRASGRCPKRSSTALFRAEPYSANARRRVRAAGEAPGGGGVSS